MKENKDVTILAIESSCDETAAAVVRNGREVLSNVISSQIDLHKLYGGVVPEIASRKHIEKINQVIEETLKEAGKTLDDIDAIGVMVPVLLGHFLLVWQRQRRLPGREKFHWSEFIISKGIFQQTILNIRILNHRFFVWWHQEDIRTL
mgnify:CR=1 FL=1